MAIRPPGFRPPGFRLESGVTKASVPAPPGTPTLGGLDAAETVRLLKLAWRDLGSLSEERLALLEGLSRWALYRQDDGLLPEFCGAGLCDCDGACENMRPDLREDERAWLVAVHESASREIKRREAREWRLLREEEELARQALEWRQAQARQAPLRWLWVSARPVTVARPRARSSRRVLVAAGASRDGPAREGEPEPPLAAGLRAGVARR